MVERNFRLARKLEDIETLRTSPIFRKLLGPREPIEKWISILEDRGIELLLGNLEGDPSLVNLVPAQFVKALQHHRPDLFAPLERALLIIAFDDFDQALCAGVNPFDARTLLWRSIGVILEGGGHA